MPEELPTPQKSLKQLEKGKNKQLKNFKKTKTLEFQRDYSEQNPNNPLVSLII